MSGSAAIAKELEAARNRQRELEERIERLSGELETARDELGAAIAMGDAEPKLKALRERVRETGDEIDGSERGIIHLTGEMTRLDSSLGAARLEEAKKHRDGLVADAVAAVHDLAEKLDAAIETLLPAIDQANEGTQRAFKAEGKAAGLAEERWPSRSQVHDRGWTQRPALLQMTRLLSTYARDPAQLAQQFHEDAGRP